MLNNWARDVDFGRILLKTLIFFFRQNLEALGVNIYYMAGMQYVRDQES